MKHSAGLVLLKPLLKVSCFLLTLVASAQDIPILSWRTHFSYDNVQMLEKSTDKVFCAAENGFFSITQSEGASRKLSKIDGLADVGVSAMHFNSDQNVLVVGYRSGLVDFVFEDRIMALKEIFTSNLEGNKQINGAVHSSSLTYLATGLGIVVVDTDLVQIKENQVQIGPAGMEVEVYEIITANNRLFVRTDVGIQSGDLSLNLLDFNNWTHYAVDPSLNDLSVVGDQVYGRVDSNLHQLINDDWVDTGIDLPVNANKLIVSEGKLLSATNQMIYEFSGTAFEVVAQIEATAVNDIVEVGDQFWIADESDGLIASGGSNLSPDGPVSDAVSNVKIVADITYAFHAPDASGYDGSEKRTDFSVFESGSWTSRSISNFSNVSDVALYGGNLFFSSIGDGLFNESIEEIILDIPQSSVDLDTIISSLAVNQNLWISSFDNSNPVHFFDGETWNSLTSGKLLGNEFSQLELSEREILWARRPTGTIVVFDKEEDQVTTLLGLPGSASDMTISIEDDGWVVTSDGPASYANASFIFENNASVRPTFDNRTLFENENVYAVETDGGNRVWFATDRGLWVFDENVSEQVALFNESNSPIPSDVVLDLAYNKRNGEMFIVTDKGLVSYRSASSVSTGVHRNVTIFPNPVEPDYTGAVGMKGLAKNVSIKITDIGGNLVKEVRASGGSASWDLRNLKNREVVTGVYLFFSSTSDGEETYVGKIAVIR